MSKIPERFNHANEAAAWYNGWLTTQAGPSDAEGCRECSPKFGGWDPVLRWRLPDGSPLYWYIVGTAGAESLVLEGEETVRGWANEYYHYYALVFGREGAEAITSRGSLPMKRPPEDLLPSTPESLYWTSQYAKQVLERGDPA